MTNVLFVRYLGSTFGVWEAAEHRNEAAGIPYELYTHHDKQAHEPTDMPNRYSITIPCTVIGSVGTYTTKVTPTKNINIEFFCVLIKDEPVRADSVIVVCRSSDFISYY